MILRYAGWPNVFSALPVARDVFEARRTMTKRARVASRLGGAAAAPIFQRGLVERREPSDA
jgi:hypothetical protein